MRLILCLLALFVSASARAEQPHSLTGDIRYHRAFHSRFLPDDRDIIVYLPPGYEADKAKRYPVFYLHDGQNLFDGATSFIPGQEWHADETAQALIEAGKIRPLIIVGIYNGGESRIDDYTQRFSEKFKKGGKADLYGRLIVEELKPFIDAQYRTLPDDSGLGGSSLGGLVSMYLGLKYPAVFSKLAVMSPSVWWGDRQVLKDVAAAPAGPRARIWLDIGTHEGKDDFETVVAEARMLRDGLEAKGWVQGRDLAYFEDKGAEHNEGAWSKRFGGVLEFLYPPH